jgi:hypothetical protein
VNEKGQIRFGLGAIKGMGEAPSEAIYLERQNGRFKDIYDFFERMPSSQVNKRVVESLVIAGAFDELDSYHRAQYFDVDNAGRTNIEKLLRYGQSFKTIKIRWKIHFLLILQMRFRSKDRNFCLVQNGKICINSIVRKKSLVSIFRRIL